MKTFKAAAILIVAVTSTGCSTAFYGSAPTSREGTVYVVGTRAGFLASHATIWRCPAAGAGDCVEVEVTEDER